MLDAALRRSGGSLILTIPPSYAEQNGLQAGSRVEILVAGSVSNPKPLPANNTRAT
jgi:antitoxin component of MazEF toxin-antitoxin module